MKVICIQNGARHGYAVPAALAQAGLLERFYTDVAGNVGLGGALGLLGGLVGPRNRLRRLAGRRVPEEVRERTRTFALPLAKHAWRSSRRSADAAERFREQLRFNDERARAMIGEGFGAATHVLSMLGEGGPYLREAQRRELRVVSDVYIMLGSDRIVAEERRRFPGWQEESPDYAAIKAEMRREDHLLRHSDWFLCPSEAVQDDLLAEWGVDRCRTEVVPYGVSPKWFELEPKPVRGRILFAGAADLRKGVHYLALAAGELAGRGYHLEVRVAGNVSEQVRGQGVCKHLTFLGRVDRSMIHREFQQADLFVLPSLAEGSAGVTYEALAAGLPVVTTRAAGSVVRDRVDGRIVPERNPHALAEAIAEIVEDRMMRDRMARAARERAREYTWDRYGVRLVAALRRMD